MEELTPEQRQRFRQMYADAEEWLREDRMGEHRRSLGLDRDFEQVSPIAGFTFRDYVEMAHIAKRMGRQAPSAIAEVQGISEEDLMAMAEIPLDPWPPAWLVDDDEAGPDRPT